MRGAVAHPRHHDSGDIVIRPARRLDGPEIGRVGHAAWLKGIGVHVGPEAHARITPATFALFATVHRGEIVVAEVGGAVAGFAGTELGDNYISDVWVSPDHEGRGVATALIAAVEKVIAGRGFDCFEIEVLSANERALRLYRHLGYETVWEGSRDDPALALELPKTRLRKMAAA
jgi:ribosomal-protein-alanine N-acetyltransferase